MREENTLNARNLIPEGVEEPSGKVAGASDVKLRHVHYNSPEVTAAGIDNIVTKHDRASGMVMDAGAQVGLRKTFSKCRSQFSSRKYTSATGASPVVHLGTSSLSSSCP
jgi:hypothetical protein